MASRGCRGPKSEVRKARSQYAMPSLLKDLHQDEKGRRREKFFGSLRRKKWGWRFDCCNVMTPLRSGKLRYLSAARCAAGMRRVEDSTQINWIQLADRGTRRAPFDQFDDSVLGNFGHPCRVADARRENKVFGNAVMVSLGHDVRAGTGCGTVGSRGLRSGQHVCL